MLKKIFILLSLFLLFSCSEERDPANPAQEQINNYSKKLEDCQENAAKKSEEEKQKQQAVQEEKPPVHVRGYAPEPDDMVLGNRDSKTVVVEYFSPTCPHCVTYYKRIFPEIKTKYIDTGKIAYIIREFIGTKQDLEATVLSRCVGSLDSYLNFKKAILEQQDNWAFSKNYSEILTNMATLGGVSPEQYTACLSDKTKIQPLIENTALIAKEPKFVGTPSFFINGKQFTEPYTFEELAKAIDAALADGK